LFANTFLWVVHTRHCTFATIDNDMVRLCFIAIFALVSCRGVQVVDFTPSSLHTSGPVAIDVHSFGGEVIIVADPDAIGTTVSVEQHEMGLSATPAPEAKMHYTTSVDSGLRGEVVRVVATLDNNPLGTISAKILIRSSAIHDVSVRTSRGSVTILGVSGSIDVQTSDGNVRIVTPLVMNEEVTVENTRGDIIYRVRSESSGMIDATAMNGEAVLDLHFGKATILPGSTGDHLVANFNDGTNPITMRTFDGDVRITVVSDPVGSEPWFSTEWISW